MNGGHRDVAADLDTANRKPTARAGRRPTERQGTEAEGEALTERLPELLDAKGLQTELGVTRAAASKIMQLVPVVAIPGLRKSYCRRSDIARLLDERTFEKGEVVR